METKAEIMTENFCNDCDEVLNAVFDEKDFWDFKVGRIRCKCGCVVKPCNECFGTEWHDRCGDCPWEKAAIKDAMSDEEVMRWLKQNDPEIYAVFKSGRNGDYYNEVIAKIEKEGVAA